MKLIIRPSNLLFRMYARDGWDQELCNSFLLKGNAEMYYFPHDENPYWVYGGDCKIDIPKMIKECVLQPCSFWSEREKALSFEQVIHEYLY